MVNPQVQFPFATEVAEGVVYSGVVGPVADGTYTVMAVCPDSRAKVYYSTGYEKFEDAVRDAEHTAWQWFDKDEPQIKVAA